MKFQHVVGSVVAVGVTATLLFFSCGKGSDSGDGNGDTATSDGKDVTQAFTLAIAGAQLDMPAGDMVAGAKISLAATTVPAEISAVVDASPASIAIQIAGSLASGAPVAQLPAPFTVSLDISPTAALAAVEKTNANLCVVTKSVDNTLKIWRFASLTVDEASKKVVFHSIWLGAFRALYCGDTFKDVAEVNAAGTEAAGAGTGTGTGDSIACNLPGAVEGTVGSCLSYAGKTYKIAEISTQISTSCTTSGKGTIVAACSTDGIGGVCVNKFGTTSESAINYYSSNYTAEVLASVKASCEKQSDSKWFDAGAYTPTAEAAQTEPPTSTDTNTNTNTKTNTSTNTATSTTCGKLRGCDTPGQIHLCRAYVGGDYTNAEATCALADGSTYHADGCPTTNALGCCHPVDDTTNPGQVVDIVMYSGGAFDADTAAAYCADDFHGTWYPQ